jgi:hypothetical protein
MWYNILLQVWMCTACDKPLDQGFPLPCKCDHNPLKQVGNYGLLNVSATEHDLR